ncbi:TAXI family TRAP transporter solute-binding subunit [Thiothrix nivea]|uniref:TAXI family TRAP transporter solute-binding subunit n=1 Tax=Thiothrix nivea TaxID=1031 RepID=UPI0012B698A5|nr:TAXI family TRAP transporter solute-binding subunit [Thiothrix nivea]
MDKAMVTGTDALSLLLNFMKTTPDFVAFLKNQSKAQREDLANIFAGIGEVLGKAILKLEDNQHPLQELSQLQSTSLNLITRYANQPNIVKLAIKLNNVSEQCQGRNKQLLIDNLDTVHILKGKFDGYAFDLRAELIDMPTYTKNTHQNNNSNLTKWLLLLFFLGFIATYLLYLYLKEPPTKIVIPLPSSSNNQVTSTPIPQQITLAECRQEVKNIYSPLPGIPANQLDASKDNRYDYWIKQPLPFLTGPKGGTYFEIAKDISQWAEHDWTENNCRVGDRDKCLKINVIETGGGVESLKMLKSTADAAIGLAKGDILDTENSGLLTSASKLYTEEIHVFAKNTIEDISKLENKRVVLGSEKLGSRITAERLFDLLHIKITPPR